MDARVKPAHDSGEVSVQTECASGARHRGSGRASIGCGDARYIFRSFRALPEKMAARSCSLIGACLSQRVPSALLM